MKVGPKSSLRPFLHRALQIYIHIKIVLQICGAADEVACLSNIFVLFDH